MLTKAVNMYPIWAQIHQQCHLMKGTYGSLTFKVTSSLPAILDTIIISITSDGRVPKSVLIMYYKPKVLHA